MTHISDHLRQLSVGEDVGNIDNDIRNRKTYSIQQVDGMVDSRDSFSLTPDLTISPENTEMNMKTDKTKIQMKMTQTQMK